MKFMKTNIICMLFSFVLTGGVTAQQSYDMAPVNELITSLVNLGLDVLDNAFEEDKRDAANEYIQLQNKCATDWSSIIDDFESIQGGDNERKLVISAIQVLGATNYINAIDKFVARYEAGTLDKKFILEVLRPRGRMEAFLADNHAHARVVTALNKIKVKVAGDVELTEEINDILNGNAKLEIDLFRSAHIGVPEGNIPSVLIP